MEIVLNLDINTQVSQQDIGSNGKYCLLVDGSSKNFKNSQVQVTVLQNKVQLCLPDLISLPIEEFHNNERDYDIPVIQYTKVNEFIKTDLLLKICKLVI